MLSRAKLNSAGFRMSAEQVSEEQILAPDVDLPDQLPWQTPEDLQKPALSSELGWVFG